MPSARARREQELCQLVLEGVPLRTLGKSGHWIIGRLHIYAACGRWFNEDTGRRGRLKGHSMREIVEQAQIMPMVPYTVGTSSNGTRRKAHRKVRAVCA
jgi:hypothetical protein